MKPVSISLYVLTSIVLPAAAAVPPGTHARFLSLTCKPRTAPPFAVVDVTYGPNEAIDGQVGVWWQLEARTDPDAEPLFQLQALTNRDPLRGTAEPLSFHRYILHLPATNETLEYRNVHTGRALLPGWTDFSRHFVPVAAKGARSPDGVPQTCGYLGHVLTLKHIGRDVPWKPLDSAKVLELNPELLVGTSRNFRDAECRRLPQKPERQNYSYVPFVKDEYPVMIEAGINLFIVSPEQELFVRGEPVFYVRPMGGKKPMKWPADFYRSNYFGSHLYLDEPSVITVGDKLIHNTLWYFSDAAALFERRTRERYDPAYPTRELRNLDVNLGDLELRHEYFSWETYYDTAFYQMAAGPLGIVHEGRYQLEDFDQKVGKWLSTPRKHTAEQLLRYHYAFLRGGTRPFGKYWGTAIYGQCDPKIAPLAMTLAYDMGARCVWFWTSDHDHHVPWPEQLELARTLKAHAAAHPRPSIFAPPPERDLVITIPYGYFLSLEHLWWVRELDEEGKNESSRRFRRLMERAHREIEEALARGDDFDITIDDGREITGYRRIIRITDAE
ncbi:MAG TPA: hypothetical protein PL151_19150 [Phycisphaerae bacterium]|nr:hypothetical protein [Phycisphaerae bacterium]HOJ75034.1 hypothetical protein [Phycisphaerae bacterium]HOM51905.1 hypothetical protein [Phycisphaerae bacterium]HOQ88368.1 hypothetical protein [Phycisphaerae bacterium]HPP28065.1 hypothetical protein [Phycisphaerae bacterium]